MLAYTVFGRHLYGVGGNREGARLSGLKVDRIVIITFVITGAGLRPGRHGRRVDDRAGVEPGRL